MASQIRVQRSRKKIIHAANDKNAAAMQVHVQGQKLFEREFKCHDKCDRDYTRPLYEASCDESKSYLINFIKREVIQGKRVVSMTEITEVYGEDATDRKKGRV